MYITAIKRRLTIVRIGYKNNHMLMEGIVL